MYQIYINNIPVILTTKITTEFPTQTQQVMQVSYRNPAELSSLIHYIEKGRHQLRKVYLLGTSLAQIKRDFFANYQLVDAAGGVVFNAQGQILLIFRKGKWDLPKGKVEKNEHITQAAIREVLEETGLQHVELQAQTPIILPINQTNVTYHTFPIKSKRILKTTYWYKMFCSSPEHYTPQLEEDITEVRWVNVVEIPFYCQNTYNSIIDVLQTSLPHIKLKTTR